MAYEIEKIDGEPIIVVTYKEPYSPNEDVIQTNRLVAKYLDDIEGPVYLINDIRQVRLSFTSMVQTMAAAFRDETTLEADRIKGVAVGAGRMLKMMVDSAKQMQFGNVNIDMFDTPEEAIAFAREQVAAAKTGE